MIDRASAAIVHARLHRLMPHSLVLFAVSLGFGWAQDPHQWPVLPLFFVYGVALALSYLNTQPHAEDAFTLCEESAPLFGRQRARASALYPVAVVVLCTLFQYAGARLNPHYTAPVGYYLSVGIAAVTCALVALSIPLRSRTNQLFYAALTFLVAFACGILALTFGTYVETAFCALVSYVALRQYGEALARYDPLPGGA